MKRFQPTIPGTSRRAVGSAPSPCARARGLLQTRLQTVLSPPPESIPVHHWVQVLGSRGVTVGLVMLASVTKHAGQDAVRDRVVVVEFCCFTCVVKCARSTFVPQVPGLAFHSLKCEGKGRSRRGVFGTICSARSKNCRDSSSPSRVPRFRQSMPRSQQSYAAKLSVACRRAPLAVLRQYAQPVGPPQSSRFCLERQTRSPVAHRTGPPRRFPAIRLESVVHHAQAGSPSSNASFQHEI